MEAMEPEGRRPRVGYPIHRLAQAMPEMPENEFQLFKEDIRQNGQLWAIDVLDGMVLDGRHRQRACLELGIEPWYNFLEEGTDPLQHVLSSNRFRRHATKGQMAIAAAKVYLVSQGLTWNGNQDTESESSDLANMQILNQDQASSMFGVSKRLLNHAKDLFELGSNASESLRLAAEQGLLAVTDACSALGETRRAQDAAVELVRQEKAKTVSEAVSLVYEEKAQPAVVDTPSLETWHSAKGDVTLHKSGIGRLRELVPPDSVDAIITGVPGGEGAWQVLRELAVFASHALKPDGAMILLCEATRLPEVFRNLRHKDLRFIVEFDYRFDAPTRKLDERHGVELRRMPLLIYGKADFVLEDGDDVIQLPPLDHDPSDSSIRRRREGGVAMVVKRFTKPEDMICDPLLVSQTMVVLAAIHRGCRFVGGCDDGRRFEYVRDRLIRDDERSGDGGE